LARTRLSRDLLQLKHLESLVVVVVVVVMKVGLIGPSKLANHRY
jgi:hypothetical protein